MFWEGISLRASQIRGETKIRTGVEFITGGVSSLDSGKVTGNLETKYKVKDLGLTFTKKWSTDNTLNSTLDVTTNCFLDLK